MPSRRVLMLLPCLAAGCHLVDQRDFDASAGRPPVPPPAAVGPAPPPTTSTLVTIRYATPDPQYREALANAVRRALDRKPDVLFTVTTLVPLQPGPDAQASQAQLAAASGRDVAQAIVESGAATGQVEQAVRVQPGLPMREVRVDVH